LRRPALTFGRERGQAAILIVVAMGILLIGALGLAIDGGQMYAHRQMAQAAADAAAQAGIMSVFDGTNATSAYPFGTGSPPIASSVCTTTDARTPCVYARNNGFGGTAADTVTLSFPAAVAGVTFSSATVPALAVTVQRTLKTGLIRFVGAAATVTITAKATAAIVAPVSPDCIYVLSPSVKDAFSAGGSATVDIRGCSVAVNSNDGEAMAVTGSATLNASSIDVVGGVSIQGSASTTPAPVTGTKPVADPFASLPALVPGSCATHPTNYSPAPGAVLTPGTYCGGISVGHSATFAPGIYIMNGGGISFGANAIVSGSGVMFYLTGTNATYGPVTVNGGAILTFSAPTSGPYLGVLFFQDRSITSSNVSLFNGGSGTNLTGTLYFPTTAVSYSGGTTSISDTTAIVAWQVTFTGNSSINYDTTGLKTGLVSKAVALVQ
jgi:hypothetical protein